MEELVCYFNGDYVKESEVKIGMWDTALWEGTVYDIQRTYNHVPFFWKEHIDRLFRSLRYAHIDPGLTPDEMYKITLEVFKRNEKYLAPEDDYNLIQVISRGARPALVSPLTRPTVLVTCQHFLPLYEFQAKRYQEGIHLVVVNTRQIPPQCLDPKAKQSNRLCNTLAGLEARMVDPEAFPLMLDIYGFAAESERHNFFMVRDNRLLTSELTNCLGGITRATILKLAKELGIESAEMNLSVYDLYNADEIFLSANGFTIFPVAKFNDRALGKPIPGPITQQLLSAFSKLVGVDIVQRVVGYVQAKAKATG